MAASGNFSQKKLKKTKVMQKPRLCNKKDDQIYLNKNWKKCYIQNRLKR